MKQESTIFTPTQVSQYIKAFMDRDRLLSGLLVAGEISNYKVYPSGHHYFTLKDVGSALRCVMFRGDAASLRFQPKNGMQVIAAGRITVFPRDGQYQMYCVRLTSDGAGDLHLAFEQLKERLFQEGLFDQTHKKPLPKFPTTITLVTSPAGAAVRDMLRILGARWPLARVQILPVRVQGEGAAEEIAAAIRWANLHQVADLLITGRGGGSMEDLWAFNEEAVARAIYDSAIPVISAVGHEPDVTIADFVADLRAATPSNAAELAVPDQNEVYAALLGAKQRQHRALERQIQEYRTRLTQFGRSRIFTNPVSYFQDKRLLLDYQNHRLTHAATAHIFGQRERLAAIAAALDAMSPLKVLGRGYAIAQREDGTLVTSVSGAKPGDVLSLRLSDGSLDCRVEHGKEEQNGREKET